MRLQLEFGRQHVEVEADASRAVASTRAPLAPAIDAAAAVRAALEAPIDYPPLRRALIPGDHVAIVLDEKVPQLPKLLVPILEHIASADVQPEAITLVCLPPSSGQAWADELPEQFQDVRIEVHQPGERRSLAYLATTGRGRRIYLNRSVVDADQAVVLARRRYDPLLGYGGTEGALFPGLSDTATRRELGSRLDTRAPGHEPWALRQEAGEVVWQLGAPFFVQVIEGAGEDIAHVVAGPTESGGVGDRLLDARWRLEVAAPADVVVATVGGDPSRHSSHDFARAFLAASRVVRPGGSVVLLTDATPELGPSFDIFRREEDPAAARRAIMDEGPEDLAAGFLWASAATNAHLYLRSGLADDVVEEIYATPIERLSEVERLLAAGGRWLHLPDAHKSLAVLQR